MVSTTSSPAPGLSFITKSFEKITGPKIDTWLVKTVGVLVCAIAVTILAVLVNRTEFFTAVVLCICSSTGFAIIEMYYVFIRRISRIYLADAVLQVNLATALLFSCNLRLRY